MGTFSVPSKEGEAVCLLAEKMIIKTAVCLLTKKNDKHTVYRKQFKVNSVHFTICHQNYLTNFRFVDFSSTFLSFILYK